MPHEPCERSAHSGASKESSKVFTGDTLYGDKSGKIRDFRMEKQAEYENLDDRLQSARLLLDYEFNNLYPFHYSVIEGTAVSALRHFVDQLD